MSEKTLYFCNYIDWYRHISKTRWDIREWTEEEYSAGERAWDEAWHDATMYHREELDRLEAKHSADIAQLEQEIRLVRARNERLEAEALDDMVAENQRLGLYDDGPAVKTYCGGKPNYCTTQEPEYVIDCPRCGHCCPERKWVGLSDDDFYGQSELQVLAMKYAESKLKAKNI